MKAEIIHQAAEMVYEVRIEFGSDENPHLKMGVARNIEGALQLVERWYAVPSRGLILGVTIQRRPRRADDAL